VWPLCIVIPAPARIDTLLAAAFSYYRNVVAGWRGESNPITPIVSQRVTSRCDGIVTVFLRSENYYYSTGGQLLQGIGAAPPLK
jgi:hypothetical protein